MGWVHYRTISRIFSLKWALFCGFTDIHWLTPTDITVVSRPCWQLLAKVQINAKGMIRLFSIEIVSHAHLTSFILWRILMHWYQGGIFFFTIYLAMIYWLRLPSSQRITDPFWEIRFSHISWMCMWHRSPERVRGETDFEEQQSVNLCVVTPMLPLVWVVDSPMILCCCSLYSVALFMAW